MTEPPPLRIIDTDPDTVRAKPAPDAAPERDARALSSLDKIALYLIVFMLLLAPLMAGLFASLSLSAIPPQDAISWLQILSVPIVSLVAALALGVTVAREWQKPVAMGPVGGLAGAGCVLAIWAAVSLAAHTPVNAARLDTWVMLLAALTTGGLASRLGRDPRALTALMLTIVAAGSLAGGWGIHEYLEQWKQGNSAHRVFGTFINPDFLAGYLLLTLPLTLACFVSARERMARLLIGLGLGLQTACLLLTGSRAGVAMLFVVVLAWLILLVSLGLARGLGRMLVAGLGVMLLSALLASPPLLIRLTNTGKQAGSGGPTVTIANVAEAADTQAHSGKFRQVTWTATLRMARANLLMGTGIGSYETAYPRYAIASPTAHAHNSYLQWMAETGVPGALSLLAVLASSTAFAVYVLFLNLPRKPRSKETTAGGSEFDTDSPDLYIDDIELADTAPTGRKEEKKKRRREEEQTQSKIENQKSKIILLTGLLASIVCSALHSLFDSVWYIMAIALTLSAIVGLLVAQARDIAPLATQTPRPLSKGMLAACGIVALVLVWRGTVTYLSRFQAAQAMLAVAEFQEQAAQGLPSARDTLQAAVRGYQSAADSDPFATEPLAKASSLYQLLQDPDNALKTLQRAARLAPSGKTFYQLGQFQKRKAVADLSAQMAQPNVQDVLSLSGDNFAIDTPAFQPALEALTTAREYDPNNLQTLRALAETYALSGNASKAVQTYQDMADLETTPVGTVRAMPEATETEYAYAHARVGKRLEDQHKAGEASAQFQQAAALLRTYWQHRGYEIYQMERAQKPEKAQALTTLYDQVLTEWQKLLQTQGAGENLKRAEVAAEQATYHQEQKADEEAAQKAASLAAPTPSQNTP